jgi:nucleotide-binding universal stress UspA family protein
MRVLIGIDSSMSSHHALEQALHLLNLSQCSFLLLSVEEIVALPTMTGASPFDMLPQETLYSPYDELEINRDQERRTISALEWAREFCERAGVECKTILEIGDPKHVICQVAEREKPDLIVVGSEGRGVIERTILGSVSDFVLHHTHYPVLVIRNDNHPAK